MRQLETTPFLFTITINHVGLIYIQFNCCLLMYHHHPVPAVDDDLQVGRNSLVVTMHPKLHLCWLPWADDVVVSLLLLARFV